MSCKKRTLGLSPKELRQSIQYAINNRDRAKHQQIWLHAFVFENWLNPGPNIFFNHTLPSVFDTLGESSTFTNICHMLPTLRSIQKEAHPVEGGFMELSLCTERSSHEQTQSKIGRKEKADNQNPIKKQDFWNFQHDLWRSLFKKPDELFLNAAFEHCHFE